MNEIFQAERDFAVDVKPHVQETDFLLLKMRRGALSREDILRAGINYGHLRHRLDTYRGDTMTTPYQSASKKFDTFKQALRKQGLRVKSASRGR